MIFIVSGAFSQTNNNIQQPISINEDGADPAASAILDVQSASKGVLVPRMTTGQRNAIASPTVGLLVFDTTTSGFWFYSGSSWVPLQTTYVAGSGINITGDIITNTGDTDPGNDITTATVAGGDLSGNYPNPVVAANAIGSNEITNGTITTADLAPGVIPAALPPNGSATGDLSGTYPAPVVDGLQGRAVSANIPVAGQVLKYDGAQWKPDTDISSGSGSALLPCGEINSGSADPNYKVGIGLCPTTDSVRLHVKGTSIKNVGMRIENNDGFPNRGRGVEVRMNGGNFLRGLDLRVENGSTSNDGVVLFSKSFNNAWGLLDTVISDGDSTIGADIVAKSGSNNIGLKVFADHSGLSFTQSTNQNIGALIQVKNNPANSSNVADHTRDIGLYAIAEDKVGDYAAYFDGDVGIPHEIEFINTTNGNQWAMYINRTATGSCGTNTDLSNDLFFQYENTVKGILDSGTGGFCPSSDRRLKENILSLPSQLPGILQLNPVSYNFISDKEKKKTIGFIAQEVESLYPNLVNRTPDEQLGELLTLNYDAFSVLSIKAIQEQQQIIEAQKTELESQKTRLDRLEQELADIRNYLKIQAMTVAKKE
jgi:hypothetical protein